MTRPLAPALAALAFLAVAAAPPGASTQPGYAHPPVTAASASAPATPAGLGQSPRPPSPPHARAASPAAEPVRGPRPIAQPAPPPVVVTVVNGVRTAAVSTAPLGPSLAGLALLVIGGLVLVSRVRGRGR